MAEDQLEAEDLLKIIVREFRRFKAYGQDLWRLLTSQQKRRVGIERGVIEDRWGPDPDRNEDVRDRTARYEREAAQAQQQVDALESQNQDLRTELDRERQDQDRDLNNDRDRDGIDDRVENRTDLDRDHRDDATERRDDVDQQNDNANDRDGDGVDDAVERREDDRAREDEEKRKQEQDRQQDREDGIDPVTAGAAAGAAAEAAELADEQDEPNADDRQEDLEAENESKVDADNALDDPSAEADNERQTEPAAEQEGVNPYVAEEGALDANDRLNENNLDQDGQQTDSTLDADNALDDRSVDADNALADPSVDADNALDEPSAEADNVRQTEAGAEQEGVSPYVSDGDNLQQDGTDLGQDGAQQEPSLDGNDPQQTDVDQSAEQSSPGAANERVVEWDTERDGSHIELNSSEESDGTSYRIGENGASLTVHGGEQGQEQSAPDAEGQEQGGTQSAEAVNLDRIDGRAFTVGQNGVQFADQNEASAGAESPSTSQAQGTQRRPPEKAAEDPAIAEARATQGNKQRSGPAQELPPDEKAQFEHTRGDQEPLSKVKVDSASVATNDRPGTPAAQRDQDRDRGGRGNDGRGGDGGRGRDGR
ncbi:hypothetical protein ACWF0M_18380 [Kribbella sp. NPDC055110]